MQSEVERHIPHIFSVLQLFNYQWKAGIVSTNVGGHITLPHGWPPHRGGTFSREIHRGAWPREIVVNERTSKSQGLASYPAGAHLIEVVRDSAKYPTTPCGGGGRLAVSFLQTTVSTFFFSPLSLLENASTTQHEDTLAPPRSGRETTTLRRPRTDEEIQTGRVLSTVNNCPQ